MSYHMHYVCDECVRALEIIGPSRGYGLLANSNMIARHPSRGPPACVSVALGYPAATFVALVSERRRNQPTEGS